MPAPREESEPRDRGHPLTIMVVDDEAAVRQTLGEALEGLTAHRVESFGCPVRALERLGQPGIDLVISDFSLPAMNGIEFLAKVRQLAPSVPRILLTGESDEACAVMAINRAAICQYLEKPWCSGRLGTVIERVLQRSRLIRRMQSKMSECEKAKRELLELRDEVLRALG